MTKSILEKIGGSEPIYEIEQPNSKKEFKRFTLFCIVQRNIKHIIPVFAFILFFGLLIYLTSVRLLGIIFISCSIVIPIFMLYTCFATYSSFLSKNEWYLKNINTYKFFDEVVHIKSQNSERYIEKVVTYSSIYKVYETSKNFYIYITKNSSIIISKDSMRDINMNDYKAFLFSKIDKSKIKNGFGYKIKVK